MVMSLAFIPREMEQKENSTRDRGVGYTTSRTSHLQEMLLVYCVTLKFPLTSNLKCRLSWDLSQLPGFREYGGGRELCRHIKGKPTGRFRCDIELPVDYEVLKSNIHFSDPVRRKTGFSFCA